MKIVKAWKFERTIRVKVWLNDTDPQGNDDVATGNENIRNPAFINVQLTPDIPPTFKPNPGDILTRRRQEIDFDIPRFKNVQTKKGDEIQEKTESDILTEIRILAVRAQANPEIQQLRDRPL